MVDEIFDPAAAAAMGITEKGQVGWERGGRRWSVPQWLATTDSQPAPLPAAPPAQVCVMIHTGSRGLGHQVCTDALAATDRCVGREGASAAAEAALLAGQQDKRHPAGTRRQRHPFKWRGVRVRLSTAVPVPPLPRHRSAMARAHVRLVDRQLACMPLGSPEGHAYLGAMQVWLGVTWCRGWWGRWAAGGGRAPAQPSFTALY